ncbi:hypothetical protein OESDEN_22862 [Oesophagostomum dentatum]|uniref:Uncharacterized protein n=1 Tax=Oesophagostomum dentatum TaxID=61180 RepID=A0A0B1RWQ9_OESDE|nr:hypothetical protein OESDEN_22862 [Oesophagostomum dentatum]
MNSRWLQLCVFAIGVFVIATPDPNFKARLYKSALEFLSKTTKEVIEKQFKKLEFPDVEYNITVGPGSGTFNAYMKYEKLVMPK